MSMINFFFLLNLPNFLDNNIKLKKKMTLLCLCLINITKSLIDPTGNTNQILLVKSIKRYKKI